MTQVVIGFIIVLVGLVVAFGVSRSLDTKRDQSAAKAAGFTLSAIGFITIALCPLAIVEAGHRGVVITFGTVSPDTLSEGLHYINPLASIKELSARVERDEEKYSTETLDTQSVSVTIITNWRPRPEKLAWLYKNYGEDYATKIIPPAIRESVKAEIAKHKVTELIQRRPEIHKAVQQTVNAWLTRYELMVLEIAIADIDFSDKYDQAIEAKQVQEQQALQKKYELEKTVTEAQMAAAQAKGAADSVIARATGDAESARLAATAEAQALKIRGEAQADYNRRLAESLSPILVQSEYVKRWDGKLPTYSLGTGAFTMLTLPNFDKK